MALPPDTGAWWGRRPVSGNARFQPAARPEVVALCDSDRERVTRVAETARVRAIYTDWQTMLREMEPDAVLCVAGPEIAAEVITETRDRSCWLWIDGPPAASPEEALYLSTSTQDRAVNIWCSQPLPRAQAHRTIRELLGRNAIGPVSALSLRWPRPLQPVPRAALPDYSGLAVSPTNFAATYEAFTWLLDAASPLSPSGQAVRPQGVRAVAAEHSGAASLWLQFQHGLDGRSLAATAVFASADPWNTPLPQMELCGTQGRSLTCEGGRRVWLHAPRETTRLLEPPGMAMHISPSNLNGIAEDLKAFLARAAAGPEEGSDYGLGDAVVILRLMEAVGEALSCGMMVEADLRRPAPIQWVPPIEQQEDEDTETPKTKPTTGHQRPAADELSLRLPL
jgi:predicted dehydrogenase